MRIKIIIALIIFLLPISSSAYDPENGILGDVKDYLPEAVQLEPDGKYDIEFFVSVISQAIMEILTPTLKNFAVILGLIVISAAFAALKNSISSDTYSHVFDYVSALCIALTMYSIITGLWEQVQKVLEQLNLIMNSMLPVMTTLYTIGGNVTTAVISNAGLMAALTLMENICYYGLYPILQICFGISLISGITNAVNLSGVSGFIRNTFTFILVFVTTLLSTILAYQTNLSLSADNAAARTVKFAAGSMIPIVGGAVGEAVRALGGSIGYIKSTVGVLAVFAIILMVVPALTALILNKLSINFAAVIAKILGCDKECAFMNEIQGLLNFALAMVCTCSTFFIFSLTLFIQSASAVS